MLKVKRVKVRVFTFRFRFLSVQELPCPGQPQRIQNSPIPLKLKGAKMFYSNPSRPRFTLLSLTLVLVMAFLFSSCRPATSTAPINLSDPGESATSTPRVGEAPLRIAVAAMISPDETFGYYRDLLDYIGRKMGRSVELVQRDTYAEVNDLLE